MASNLDRARELLARKRDLAAPESDRLARLVAALEKGLDPRREAELARFLEGLDATTVFEVPASATRGTSDPRIPAFEDSDPGEDSGLCQACGGPVGPEGAAGHCAGCIAGGRGPFDERGDYVLVRRLGEGGMGEVHLALARATRRLVAFKVLREMPGGGDDELVVRFWREVEVLRQLDHPNIVRYLDSGDLGGRPFLVMEYVRGKTLARVLARKGRFGVRRAVEVAYQVAKALDHAFTKGVVHRDLKPDNVMIDAEARVRVLDLGLAKPIATSGASGITASGAVLGTLVYMAPEQLEDAKRADQRADVYSLGTILYEMVSGERAYSGEDRTKLFARKLRGEYRPLVHLAPDAPPALTAVVDRALARDPGARFRTPGEMRAALRALRSS